MKVVSIASIVLSNLGERREQTKIKSDTVSIFEALEWT